MFVLEVPPVIRRSSGEIAWVAFALFLSSSCFAQTASKAKRVNTSPATGHSQGSRPVPRAQRAQKAAIANTWAAGSVGPTLPRITPGESPSSRRSDIPLTADISIVPEQRTFLLSPDTRVSGGLQRLPCAGNLG